MKTCEKRSSMDSRTGEEKQKDEGKGEVCGEREEAGEVK